MTAPRSEWRPIEEAPKDGTPLWLYPGCLLAWWEFGDEAWLCGHLPLTDDMKIGAWPEEGERHTGPFYCLYYHTWMRQEPTHWMPLPPPPSTQGDEG